MGGSFAPRDGEALTSVSAICLPVLAAGGVRLGLRSVLVAPGVARWLRFGLSCCWFFPFLLITGFPAVGDLRQELANLFNLFLGPEMYCHAAARGGFGCGYFPGSDVATQSYCTNPKLLGRLASGKGFHSSTSYQIDHRKQVRKRKY